MKLALAILGLSIGTLLHLALLMLCLFGMANSSPQQMRQIQLWMLATAIVAIASIAGGVLLIRWDYHWTCIGVSLLTAIAMWIIVFTATTP